MRMARPGSSILLNFPIRSTIHAVCWGTNRIIVFAGKEGRPKYEEGGEMLEDCLPNREELAAWKGLVEIFL